MGSSKAEKRVKAKLEKSGYEKAQGDKLMDRNKNSAVSNKASAGMEGTHERQGHPKDRSVGKTNT